MAVSFDRIVKGADYSRPTLARIWGYGGYQALARGVVTPADDFKIILFVTEEKQPAAEQYADELAGDILHWEGPSDHFAETRMAEAASTGEEVHLFHRIRHHSDFTYKGRLEVIEYSQNADGPSQFTFRLLSDV